MSGVSLKTPELTDEINVPNNVNISLTVAGPDFMLSLLGRPREKLTQDDLPITNKSLAALMVTANVGPFSTTGLRPAVESLTKVMADIAKEQPKVYSALRPYGMLVVRNMRPNPRKPKAPLKISNHAWGTAIDLLLNKKLDPYNNGKTFYGLTLIAPIFNRHGWFWGGRYRTSEDAMHFEVSKEKLLEWQKAGLFGPISKSRQETIAPAVSKPINTNSTSHDRSILDILQRGDKGPHVVRLQNALRSHNYNITSDGRFGKNTETALLDFQRKNGLTSNGIVGPKTALYLALF